MKKLIIIVGVVILIGAGVWYFSQAKFGGSVAPESYIYSHQDANFTSVSYDGGTDEFITDAAHGLIVGDAVIFNTASTAFGGADAPGINEVQRYYVITASTSTAFEIAETKGGSVLDIGATASAGGGEFVYELVEGRAQENPDLRGNTFTLDFCGDATASAALQFVGSSQVLEPDWTASKSYINIFDTIAVFDLQNNTEVEGDATITIDEAADCRQFEVYAKGLRWINMITTSFGEGYIHANIQITE